MKFFQIIKKVLIDVKNCFLMLSILTFFNFYINYYKYIDLLKIDNIYFAIFYQVLINIIIIHIIYYNEFKKINTDYKRNVILIIILFLLKIQYKYYTVAIFLILEIVETYFTYIYFSDNIGIKNTFKITIDLFRISVLKYISFYLIILLIFSIFVLSTQDFFGIIIENRTIIEENFKNYVMLIMPIINFLTYSFVKAIYNYFKRGI